MEHIEFLAGHKKNECTGAICVQDNCAENMFKKWDAQAFWQVMREKWFTIEIRAQLFHIDEYMMKFMVKRSSNEAVYLVLYPFLWPFNINFANAP